MTNDECLKKAETQTASIRDFGEVDHSANAGLGRQLNLPDNVNPSQVPQIGLDPRSRDLII
jgi:hypothetical protein